MGNLSGSMEKDPAPFAMPGAIHQGVGHASMAEEIPLFAPSMEHEGMVGKLHNRQFPRVHQSWNGSMPEPVLCGVISTPASAMPIAITRLQRAISR
jgi:hypothetical protein